jgi:hypothetical protein
MPSAIAGRRRPSGERGGRMSGRIQQRTVVRHGFIRFAPPQMGVRIDEAGQQRHIAEVADRASRRADPGARLDRLDPTVRDDDERVGHRIAARTVDQTCGPQRMATGRSLQRRADGGGHDVIV